MPYELVVVELRLPGLDAFAFIREARRHAPGLRVMIVTAHSTETAAIEALNLGVAGYLVKPTRADRDRRHRRPPGWTLKRLAAGAAAEGAARPSDMIQLSSLTKRFGDRVLLESVTWFVGDRDRVGLCGPNGAGKTTLLRILAGLDEADGGEVIRPTALTFGYLPQDGLLHAGRTVFAEASDALRPLLDLKAEMHDLEHRLADAACAPGAHDAHARALQRRAGALPHGRRLRHRAARRTILRGLGFTPADFETQAEHLSGGWQMRLALAKLLLASRGCCCSTSRPTTSTSRPATGSRSTWAATRTR